MEDGFYGGDEHAGRQGRERGGGGSGSSGVRIETDTMGEVEVPAEALYGAQTQRSLENFSELVVKRCRSRWCTRWGW